MTFLELLSSGTRTVGIVVVVMAVLALVESVVPARARGPAHRAHLGPNLALTAITFATNLVLNAGLVLALAWVNAQGWAPLASLGPIAGTLVVVAALDLAWYVAHRTLHHVPWLWRIHRVHHSDAAIDVTTTIRQHPAEGLVRYAYMGAVALAIGAGPAAFAVYRAWSVFHGLLSHANLRIARGPEALFELVFVTPSMHRIHHSRVQAQTDTNFATIFSLFDRALGSWTPPPRDDVVYGLDEEDATATTLQLLRAPWRRSP
jgi:sterol desaturase/sphingolipid hydroxylase (fatty acid hydroxylase superfamily)